jgi:hypothetical protein
MWPSQLIQHLAGSSQIGRALNGDSAVLLLELAAPSDLPARAAGKHLVVRGVRLTQACQVYVIARLLVQLPIQPAEQLNESLQTGAALEALKRQFIPRQAPQVVVEGMCNRFLITWQADEVVVLDIRAIGLVFSSRVEV